MAIIPSLLRYYTDIRDPFGGDEKNPHLVVSHLVFHSAMRPYAVAAINIDAICHFSGHLTPARDETLSLSLSLSLSLRVSRR